LRREIDERNAKMTAANINAHSNANARPGWAAAIAATVMCLAALVGFLGKPNTKAVDAGRSIDLKAVVPVSFAGWRELPTSGAQVVNPQTQELLDKLYSQLLTRSYVNADGYVIMLSLAYGDDQRGALQAHKPEVCYPAQGFKLHSNVAADVSTDFGAINARRLSTSMGARQEPVTYWFTAGDRTVRSALEKRWVEMRLALTGQVPDGLLFRVSSIDPDTARAFGMHEKFVNELLRAAAPRDRVRLAGV
jgi:EpsI family protein